ncbi:MULTISPECIES: hypothetical protein [Falsihalocynthiibacter]|uniref:hypothetical protein n=1 Tax=Falsihalocynthiibacter TaxID=2854182 RepID=UPI003001F0C5
MKITASRLGRTVGHLLLALLNATLLLAAVCLFLELRVVKAVDGLTQTFSENLVQVAPLRDAVISLSQDAAELRGELAAFTQTPNSFTEERASALSAKVDILNNQLVALKGNVGNVMQNPEGLIDHAIEKTAQEVIDGLSDLRGCEKPVSM